MQRELFSGKTVEEAKENAFRKLKLTEEEVIIIEKSATKTLLKKKVEIEVIKKEEIIKFIKEYLINLVTHMGLKPNIEVKAREESLIFNIVSDNNSILIGKNGRTIEALQSITNQVVYNELNLYYRFVIDVSDYRQNRDKRIEKMAKMTAKEVAKSKCPIKLDPMNSYDRRIVHNALTNSNDVTTFSEGEEPYRCIVIRPKED